MSWWPDRGALRHRVAIVAGATRGAGRGIGATRSDYDRPETIEQTAALVTQAGGAGIAIAVDHLDPAQVRALAERVRRDHGHVDVLVNDIWGGELIKGGPPRTTCCRCWSTGPAGCWWR